MLPEPSSLTQWLHKGILPASQHTTVLSNVGAAKETNSQSEGSREESKKKNQWEPAEKNGFERLVMDVAMRTENSNKRTYPLGILFEPAYIPLMCSPLVLDLIPVRAIRMLAKLISIPFAV